MISEGAFLAPVRRTFALRLWKVRPWAGGPRRGQLWRARVPPVAQNTRVWLFSVHTALAVPEVLGFFPITLSDIRMGGRKGLTLFWFQSQNLEVAAYIIEDVYTICMKTEN